MATKEIKTVITINPSESAGMRVAIVEILTSMDFKPVGGGTKASITMDDSYIEVDLDTRVYKAISPKEKVDYILPKNMSTVMRKLTPPKKLSVEAMRSKRQVEGYKPVKKPRKDESNFVVGDFVRVRSTGQVYSTYETMFVAMGFKNTKRNPDEAIPFVTERIAKVFDIMHHETCSDVVCGIRFDDGEELLIAQKGLVMFEGFKKGDIVVVLPKDKNYHNVVDQGRAVQVTDGSYFVGTKLWTPVTFSNGSSNTYNLFRYATLGEIDAFTNNSKTFEIGDPETRKVVTVSHDGIVVKIGGDYIPLGIKYLREVVLEMENFKNSLRSRYWKMSIPEIAIGCTKQVTHAQLRKILNYAESIGLEK